MNYEYTKAQPITLREAGKDEKWLQELISKDPSILGLGEVLVLQRERSQPTGGRIDLILSDNSSEEALRYEVEIMLGTVDESHIIRTIEYWDIERRRFPSYQHRAVIVAEEITNRFFNVISLLNKAVPIIAIQLNAFLLADKLCLNFVRVLDLVHEEEEEAGEKVDRKYWETIGSKQSLEVMDAIIALVAKNGSEPRIKYNQQHVALATTGINFVWFMPCKGDHVLCEVCTGENTRDKFVSEMKSRGIECRPTTFPRALKISLKMKDLENNRDIIQNVLVAAEKFSKE